MDATGRELIVWEDPLAKRAHELQLHFPYALEPVSLESAIKLVLWIIEQEKK